jgi:hypothetical protein
MSAMDIPPIAEQTPATAASVAITRPASAAHPSLWSLIIGALLLRSSAFAELRARSDVFYRGFLVMLVIGLIAGAFEVATDLLKGLQAQPSEDQVIERALSGFENSYNGPPQLKDMIGSYIREGVAIGYEIAHLPPRAGVESQPLVTGLEAIGRIASTPFGFGFMGFVLLAGLMVQVTSRWLGGRATVAEMLGLSALSYAPDLFLRPLLSLLSLGGAVLSPLTGLLGFVLVVWETVIYIKATSVSQYFSVWRALGAILLAVLVAFLVVCAFVIVVIVVFSGLIASLIAATR